MSWPLLIIILDLLYFSCGGLLSYCSSILGHGIYWIPQLVLIFPALILSFIAIKKDGLKLSNGFLLILNLGLLILALIFAFQF